MNGDIHVRFCEGLGVKFPRATLPAITGQNATLDSLEFRAQSLSS